MAVLELARQYEVVSGHFPWNPAHLQINALDEIDLDWVTAYSAYKQWIEFETDRLKKSGW